MIKEFLMRKMIESKLKNVSKEDQEKMIQLVTKNPELFQKIAEEAQAKGGSMDATMEVMKKYENDLKGLI